MPRNQYISLCSVAAVAFSMSLVSYGLLPDPQDNTPPAAAQNQPVIRLEPTAVQKAAAAQIPQVEIYWDKTTGVPISLHAPDLARIKLGGRGLTISPDKDFAANSVAVLDRLSALYGFTDAQNEFNAIRVKKDELGHHHVYLRQMCQELRVVGSELLVHFNQANTPCHVNGRYVPGINIDTTPTLSDEEALAKARADLQRRGLIIQSVAAEPELVVYARNTIEGKLAYELMLDCGIGQEWCYWIDANSGSIINCFNNVRKEKPTASKEGYYDRVPAEITGNLLTGEGGYNVSLTGISILFYNPDGPDYTYYYLYNPTKHWTINNAASSGYEDTNSVARRTTAQWGTSDSAEFSAAYNFDKVQTYFTNTFHRNSYDGYGHDATVNVHYEIAEYDNAFYSSSYDAFYFLRPLYYAELAVLDICGHEFTHGINHNEINFTYQGEQGALDEALADIFGTAIEFATQPDGTSAYPGCLPGYADWLIGEDGTYPVATAMRDFTHPQRFQQPSFYQGTYWIDPTSSYDNGGVHVNCGVITFAFYLLANGDTGLNDNTYPYTVTGIGLTNAVNLIYRYQNYYATSGDTFEYIRYSWISAAYDLNSNWVYSVNSALNAVGLWSWDAIPPNPSAIYLAAGGDFDGDHKADIVGFRNNIWHIWLSASGYARADISTFTGAVGTPFAADFDGDGLADPGVYDTSSNWHLWLSSASYSQIDLSNLTGASGMPVPADFDGDGKADPAVWDFDGNWHMWFSSAGYARIDITTLKGITGGTPVAADFDGDGKADPAIYNFNNNWYVWLSNSDYAQVVMHTYGGTSSMPIPADFDGDGKADPTLYDCYSNWHMWLSGSGYAWVDLTGFRL